MQEELFGSECPIEGVIERKLTEAEKLMREGRTKYLRIYHGQKTKNDFALTNWPQDPNARSVGIFYAEPPPDREFKSYHLGHMHKQKFSLWFKIKCFLGIRPKVKGSILKGSFMGVPNANS